MKTRVRSGLLMAPLLAVVWVGGYALLAACAVLSVFAAREFYRAFETATADTDAPVRPSRRTALVSVILLYCCPFILRDGDLAWAAVSVVLCFSLLFLKNERSLTDCLVTLAGLFYVVLFIYFIYAIDLFYDPMRMAAVAGDADFISGLNLPDRTGVAFYIRGFRYNWVWLVVFSAFATDIFAYFTGRALGRRKLAPKLSPKKTVEGSAGGVAGSVVVCGLFGWFAMPEFFVHCVVLGFLGGVVSQLGDLTASAIKRRLGVKDYGALIPGHGGLLDRIDSMLFTAPLVYVYLSALSFWTLNGDMKTPVFSLIMRQMNGASIVPSAGVIGLG
jgi:phosphatidate cytidylyltransferase